MFKKQIFTGTFIAVVLTSLLLGQIFVTRQSAVAHAQTTTIDFPDMTQLSPNGQQVLYVTAQNLGMTGATIWLANADLSQATALVSSDSNGAYWVTNPIWSPDGQQIAYVKAVKTTPVPDFTVYNYEIWAIASNGTNNRLLENTLFHPVVRYGGQTSLLWNATNEVEFVNRAIIPSKTFAVNTSTLAIREVSQELLPETLPTQSSIADVPFYYKGSSPWGTQRIGNSTSCPTLASAGSTITASAMTVSYINSTTTDPGMVNNTLASIGGFDANCYLEWGPLGNAYNLLNDTSFLWRDDEDPSEWREDILASTKREVAAGIPVMLWYWVSYPTSMNFLVVTGYDGDLLTVHNPSSSTGESETREFYDENLPEIEGLSIVKPGYSFSKISPANGAEDVDTLGFSLNWNTYLPVPSGYRYCINPPITTCGQPGNTNWNNAFGETEVEFPNELLGNTEYIWQVQANIGTGPDNKVNANGGEVWTFTTGPAHATLTPTKTATKTKTPTATLPPNLIISGNTEIGNTTISVEFCPNTQFTGCSSPYSITSDSNGNYSTAVPRGYNVLLTPHVDGLAFTPAQRSYANIQQNQTNQNYTFYVPTPTPTLTITGNVGLPNVTFELCDTSSCSVDSTVSASNGNYSLTVPRGWTGTVRPMLWGYLFTPEISSYTNLQANQPNQDYTYVVSRMISGNAGMTGVILSYTVNSVAKTVTAAYGGGYSIQVPDDWTGIVTPSHGTLTFFPANYSYNNLAADQPNQNFVLTHTFKSVAAQDGWVLESNETSGVGGTMNDIATFFRLGDDAANRQYRTILSFTTGSLNNNAVIQSAVVRIKKSGMAGTDPFTILDALRVDICDGPFGTSTLELTDFNSGSAGSVTCVVPVANFNTTPVNDWYSATLPAAGRNSIDVISGVTQFRLRFLTDDNNDGTNDFMNFFSGDSTTSQPELVIKYTIPGAPQE